MRESLQLRLTKLSKINISANFMEANWLMEILALDVDDGELMALYMIGRENQFKFLRAGRLADWCKLQEPTNRPTQENR